MSAEDKAELRRRQQQAAEKRSTAWDDKVAELRRRRAAKTNAEKAATSSVGGQGTAAGSVAAIDDKLDHSALEREAAAKAKALAATGFDPYTASFNSASQARAAIQLGDQAEASMSQPADVPASQLPAGQQQQDGQTQQQQQQQHAASMSQQATSPQPTAGEPQGGGNASHLRAQQATAAVDFAIQSQDADALEAVILSISDMAEEELTEELREKMDLAFVLYEELSAAFAVSSTTGAEVASTWQQAQDDAARDFDTPVEGSENEVAAHSDAVATAFDPDAVERLSAALNTLMIEATVHRGAAVTSLKTLLKLLDNVKNNPSEAKFRKVRLENKAIKARIVEFASGAPATLLRELGFVEQTSTEDGPVLELPEDAMRVFQIRYDATRAQVESLLQQLEPAASA